MNNQITLSVVVLSYNNEQYLEDCLGSLERQNVDSYEVLIVDDSSTDNSVNVIKDFIKGKPQFKLIEKPNSGGAISSQIGIKMAEGKYCAIVDSDDIVADGAYGKLISRLESDGSDFAAGLPMRMANGFMHTFLASAVERNVFVENCVLETEEEIESFTRQVFYWNAVYRTDFLRDNQVEMPANLLIADRIFVYKATMKAKKISILSDVVYYWRKKENSDKISITDQTTEFHMISDRVDSFQAQIKLCIKDFKESIKFNKAIWERSVVRLYYPLITLASPNNESNDYKDFLNACERYRCFLLQYKAFFIHLIASADIPVMTKYITERILAKKYKQIYTFIKEEKSFANLDKEKLDINIFNSILRNSYNLSVKGISVENGREYIDFQVLNGLEDKGEFSVENVFVFNRYFNQEKMELPYDGEVRRADITDLPIATYVLNTICNKRDEKIYYPPQCSEEFSKVITVEHGDRVITFNSRFSILTIQQKRRFTILRDGKKFLLGVNQPEEIKEIFFFNVNDNKKIELERKADFYVIDISKLHKGDNILLYEGKEGLFTTVRRREFSNSILDQDIFDEIITRGKIEIELEED